MNQQRKKLQAEFAELSKKVSEVMADRGENYGGDPLPGFRSIGHLWRGLLEDTFQQELPAIPASTIAAMMTALKLSRFCRPGFQADDVIDAMGYTHIANHCRKREDAA